MGVGGILKKIGGGFLKGVDAVDKVTSHPAVVPFTLLIPWGQATLALKLVRRINTLAGQLQAEGLNEMSTEAKKAEFKKEFRKAYPEASDSEIDMLAAAFVNVEKGRVEEDDQSDVG